MEALEAKLQRNLFNAGEVGDFLEEHLGEFDISVVPYSPEDAMAKPRVMLSRLSSYCSLELPLAGSDLAYYATLLVMFGE